MIRPDVASDHDKLQGRKYLTRRGVEANQSPRVMAFKQDFYEDVGGLTGSAFMGSSGSATPGWSCPQSCRYFAPADRGCLENYTRPGSMLKNFRKPVDISSGPIDAAAQCVFDTKAVHEPVDTQLGPIVAANEAKEKLATSARVSSCVQLSSGLHTVPWLAYAVPP